MSVIAQAGIIAKASAVEDFKILQTATGSDVLLERKMFDSLQLHLDSGGRVSTFLLQHESNVWLCRAEMESGSDTAGRGKSRCTFLQLSAGRTLKGSTGLLETAEDSLEAAAVAEPRGLEPTLTPAGRRALLNLLVTSEVPTVRTLPEAVWIMETWGEDPDVEWMRTKAAAPTRSRFGRLLVIGGEERIALREVRELEERLGERSIPSLNLLRRVPDPQRRRLLLLAWLSGEEIRQSALSPEERAWSFSLAADRLQWLLTVSSAERRDWLLCGLLSVAEIEALRDRWTRDDEPALASFLRGRGPEGLRLYTLCVQPTPEQISGLLEGTVADTFTALLHGEPIPNNADRDSSLYTLEQAGALDTLSLPALSAALLVQPALELRAAWVRAQVREGLPEEVAISLVGGPVPAVAPARGPSRPPSTTWLGVVLTETLLNAAYWVLGSPAWKQWWMTAVSLHPECSGLVPSLNASYRPEVMAWLTSEVRDGLLAISALETLARWLKISQGARPTKQEVQSLLHASGFHQKEDWASIVDGSAPISEYFIQETALDEWNTLCDAGLVPLAQMVQAVSLGTNSDCLLQILPETVMDLLGLSKQAAPPPQYPPLEWPGEITPLLAETACRAEFWGRWGENGVPDEMLGWLREILVERRADAYAAALQEGQNGGLIQPAALKIVSGGLNRPAKLQQAVLWAGHEDGWDVLNLLLRHWSYPALEWLRARVTLWGFAQPLPANLTAPELLMLLPWLDPITAVEAAMSMQRGNFMEVQLFERILEKAKACEQRGGPPPPADVRERWADWCTQFAAIPGWRSWGANVRPRTVVLSQGEEYR